MNLFLYYFVFAGGDEEICDGWHAFQCKSSRVSSSSKGIIDKRSSANQEKRRLSSLAHTTFSRQGITSGTFFYVRGRRNEGVALKEKLYLQFLRNWFKIRHSWSLDWILSWNSTHLSSCKQVLAKECGLDWKSVRRLSEVQQGAEKSLDEM